MTDLKEFNPITTARKLEDSYREYLATTIHFDDREFQAQLERILAVPGYLTKGPFLEAAPPYRKDKSVADLVDEGVLCEGMLSLAGGDASRFDPNRPLYTHQVEAIRKAADDHNFAVVTGTGSGKTECFLLPILNDILTEFEQDGPSAGVRAMLLYPMNALANDQLKRLRILLAGTGITFGRYTGDTKEDEGSAQNQWYEENPGQTKLPNEIISREEIRKNPPNILLTNYSMLEYLLLRPKDAPLFEGVFGENWRHIAIDEAHVYSGALGTEIAYLLRRLKARIESETGNKPNLHCYATSATIGSEEDMPKVAVFAQDLFGESFTCEGDELDVITSIKDDPVDALDERAWGRVPLASWKSLRHALKDPDHVDGDEISEILKEAGAPTDVLHRLVSGDALLGLGQILLGEESAMQLVRQSSSLIDLTDHNAVGKLGIDGLEANHEGVEILSAMVEVLSAAQRSKDVPILTSRYHSFMRAPEGLFLNLATRELTPHKMVEALYKGTVNVPVYEVSVCRHCGQMYLLGTKKPDEAARVEWLNPRHEGTDADDEFIPRQYFRLLPKESDKDDDEEIQWLCSICGSLHNLSEGGPHRFSHEACERVPVAKNQAEARQADEEFSQCRHCGYRSRNAIQPMRVSPEAAGSVVCYDLVRDIPPFERDEPDEDDFFAETDDEHRAGSVICFSDKRQDAAFFAPAMERTYNSITRRQLIREAVDANSEDGSGCTPSAVIRWIEENADSYPSDFFEREDARDQARAWILDEFAAEDSRNSLQGLGVIRIEPKKFNEGFEDPKVKKFVASITKGLSDEGISWLTDDDFVILAKACLELLRQDNVIEVPGSVSGFRNNYEKRGNYVVKDGEYASKSQDDIVRFAGASISSTINKRVSFVMRYARSVCGVEPSREDAFLILQKLFDFFVQYLDGYHRKKEYLRGSRDKFCLNINIWRLYPHADEDTLYRCNVCGCETHLDTNGICMTSKCSGEMQQMTFAEAKAKDRYYKTVYQDEALPLDIKEHTAQLSSEKARDIQSKFIKGDVNVLSCTTTFELGVDVGDLRAIFMRNVPPSTANYTQRAGRVGRRAGKPGYAVTFARLRSHDIAHFADPPKIIAGETRVPMCYLDNDIIAKRHVYAIALSEFFRYMYSKDDVDYSKLYNDFMPLNQEQPQGLLELRDYLNSKPEAIGMQVKSVVSQGAQLSTALGVEEWSWVDDLIRVSEGEEFELKGRLLLTHSMKHADYEQVSEGIESNKGINDGKAAGLLRMREALCKQQTIPVLAETGILPKYGFPTDLVELVPENSDGLWGDKQLSLSRGLRQAIREYAPGAEVVADKKLWKSVGIKRPKGHALISRRYGECPECHSFVWPIENGLEEDTCPVCQHSFKLERTMLEPRFGFVGKKVSKGIGLHRPRSIGYVEVHFSQRWPDETSNATIEFDGGSLVTRFAGNAQLCAMNKRGFDVCPRCYRAAVKGESIEHTRWCKDMEPDKPSYYHALGTVFYSDVLELDFDANHFMSTYREDWEAAMWALVTAAATILEVPETEIGGTLYENSRRGMSIMIFDDVPGGAGHAKVLSGQVQRLVEEAYKVVDGRCGCGEETCCYGCIANYYNQARQAELSRGAAKDILGALLGKEDSVNCDKENIDEHLDSFANEMNEKERSAMGSGLRIFDAGVDTSALSFSDVCDRTATQGASDEWKMLISDLSVKTEGRSVEVPRINVEMIDDENNSAFAPLVWIDSKVMLLDIEDVEDFEGAFGRLDQISGDWRIFSVGDVTAEQLLSELKKDL